MKCIINRYKKLRKIRENRTCSLGYAVLLSNNFAILTSQSLSNLRKRIMKLALTTTLLALAQAESFVQKNLAQQAPTEDNGLGAFVELANQASLTSEIESNAS